MRWVLATALPFALTLLAAFVFQLVGWLPGSASAALAPATSPTAGEALPALAALALLFAFCWAVPRRAVIGRGSRLAQADPTAGVALALLLSIEVLLVCALNPFTALILMPAAHVAVLAALPQRPSRALIGGATLTVALMLPVLALLYYGMRLDLGLDPSNYALMLLGAATAVPVDGAPLLPRSRDADLRIDRQLRRLRQTGSPRLRDQRARAGDVCRAGLARRHGISAAPLKARALWGSLRPRPGVDVIRIAPVTCAADRCSTAGN